MSGQVAVERPPIKLKVLAARIGISKRKLLDDVKRGELLVRWVPCGTRKMGLVEPGEVDRYLQKIGLSRS